MIACARWPISVLVVTSTAVGAMGCSLEERASSASSIEDPTYRTPTRGRSASVASEDLPFTALPLLDLPRNGLTPYAITRAALTTAGTKDLLLSIRSGGLANPSTLSTSNRAWIHSSAEARALMEYVVSCALDKGVSVNTGVYSNGQEVSWPGELGLCSARPEALGNWTNTAPTPACLEIVSSCVLARVNAHNKQVTISMRGESNSLLPLRPRVPVEEEYRENGGTPIRSFAPSCNPGGTPHGSGRDCAWEGRYVGSCIPGQVILLKTTSPAMVRVCSGIYGCDHENSTATPWYAGVITSADASTGPVSFACPHNDYSLENRSYFAIMLAAPDPTDELASDVDVTVNWGLAWYPSTEQEVFSYREGAFFGNIFDAVEPPVDPDNDDQLLVGSQYACYSDLWSDGLAPLTDRLCVNRGAECFEHAPEPCQYRCGARSWDTQAYLNCFGDLPTLQMWERSITVYLNHPCDLAQSLQGCMAALPDSTGAL